jgi:glycosyltransferase involved in cell wall biosynthesis
MKIHFLTNDGSPLGVTSKTIWGDGVQIGVGGAELAMLTLCEEWTKAGHEVVLFNNPRELNASPFEQRHLDSFDPKEFCDVLIAYRSPNLRILGANTDLKVWFSTDQSTIGNFQQFRSMVDKVVCISPRHAEYFNQNYKINDAIVIDLPVRVQDYENKDIEKVKSRFIFTSIPTRGLDIMLDMWPAIKREIPDASLVVTSDYRLWLSLYGRDNERFISKAMRLPDVIYLSAIPRLKLVEEQLKAELHLYPCKYDELFCIAVAESQVAGVYTVTSDYGSLPTTNMMTIHKGDPRQVIGDYLLSAKQFVNMSEYSHEYIKEIQEKAIQRFHPDTILKQWNEKVFK